MIGGRTGQPRLTLPPARAPEKQRQSTAACERDRLRPRRASPGPPVSTLLPALSPATQASRAIPCPEVTEPVCRLPLPTLFYRPEAVHLGDLLRIWVRAGANRRSPQLDFQGPARRPWTQRELLCSWRQYTKTHSPREVIPGIRSLMQKRQLFPGFGRASQALFMLPC